MRAYTEDQVLTERQQEIVRRFAVRTPIKQIATDLGIAPSTVNDHLASARRKLGLSSNKDLARHVIDSAGLMEGGAGTPLFEGGRKDRVAPETDVRKSRVQDEPKPLMLNDSLSLDMADAWFQHREPRVVPEELDGPASLWPRVREIGKIVTMILAAIVLCLAALESVDSVVHGLPAASSN